MVTVKITTKDMDKKMDTILKRSPIAFRKHMKSYLAVGAAKIKEQSVIIAKNEAKGATSHYMQAFTISPVSMSAEGNLFIRIYNKKSYSKVVEYGGWWSKQPPWNKESKRSALDKWVKAKLAPASAKERRRLTFLIGRAIKKRSRSRGRGQEFRGSMVPGKGRVLTMTRAVLKSKNFLRAALKFHIEEALIETTQFFI